MGLSISAPVRCGLLVAIMSLLLAAPSRAINIVFDYSYDAAGNNFFGAGNPSGAAAGNQAKGAIEAAGAFYSNLLNDSFAAVVIPPNYASQVFNGVAFWNTSLNFDNPSTGASVTLMGQTRAADEYRIYVGARELGSTLGFGGPLNAGWSQTHNGGSFTQQEVNAIQAINAQFGTLVNTRGEGSGFSAWGGALSFDRVGTTWNYNHTILPSAGQNDFYSVAIHELGHALGLGASSQWTALAGGPSFAGGAAAAEYGSAPPLNPARDHWAEGTMSTVFGTSTAQEAVMDPTVTVGTRKVLTDLDAAALTDIGWEVDAPAAPVLLGDYNSNGVVDAADYTVWRDRIGGATALANDDTAGVGADDYTRWKNNFGQTLPAGSGAAVPEPTGVLLFLLGLGGVGSFAWRKC